MPSAPEHFVLGLGQIFTVLFVTLGPLKIIGPFAKLTHGIDDRVARKIALLTFVIALAAVVLGAFIGRSLLQSWSISVPAMLLTGGIIFFVVGLRLVLEQYEVHHGDTEPLPAAPLAAAMRVTFPTVVTPYGTATLIVLLTNSHSIERSLSILALVLGVMLLNLLAMVFARRILSGLMAMAFQILGAVLGVLQVALAVTLIVYSLREMGILHG